MDIVYSIFTGLRWQDIADIALNSYILFRLYVLFQGTQVFRTIAALALLWIFQQAAAWLGLIVTSWVLQGIIAVAALIVIIVFRNEIRSVLQARNIRAILWGAPRKVDREGTENIVDAVVDLARQNVGALVVLQGREHLDEIVYGGVDVGAHLSSELLSSIFWHGGPIHDGAVLIEGSRIAKAGVILPLTQETDVPREYGTRHRAAIGLTELSDALVIVVSEERGDVTVASRGRMHEAPDRAALAQILGAHGMGPETAPDQDRTVRLKLGAAACLSVLVVAGVWFSFSRGLETITTIEVPIEYMGRRPNMEIIAASINSVTLSLGGSGPLLRSIKPDQFTVRVDLADAALGANTFTIVRDDIILPAGVVLKGVEPTGVEVTLDQPVEKELPVQADWGGQLPAHLVMTDLIITPATIRIIGGNRFLEKMHTLYTEKINLDRLEASGTISARLALSPASIKIAGPSPERVSIQYVIIPRDDGVPSNAPETAAANEPP